jgi:predicted nucleic acid-binding protein
MRVVTHPTVFAHPLTFEEAWGFIESLRLSPSLGVLVETDRRPEVVRDLTREYPHMSGNLLHDLQIAALMREHGAVEIRTADTDFHQFKFLRVVNPL